MDASAKPVIGEGLSPAGGQKRLQDAAQQFEGMLLQEMLKPMQPSEDKWDTDDASDRSMDTMSSYGTEAMATAISKAGGLGIAKQVMRQVGLESDQKKGDYGTKVFPGSADTVK